MIGEFKNLNDGRLVYYITYLFVAPKFRNKRIASQLLRYLINKCKSWGIKHITLTCDTYNIKLCSFYKKIGFIPDLIMRNMKRHEIFTLYL